MSRYIATRAIRGANHIVREAERILEEALEEKGPDTAVAFPNTAYHLPLVLGMTGREVDTLGDLMPVLDRAKSLLHPVPSDRRWTPYLGETLDAGMATLLAEEVIEAVRFAYGLEPQPFPGLTLAGTRARTVTVGGEATLPFLHFEGLIPHPPAIAIEIASRRPDDWSPLLLEAWAGVVEDPAAWAEAAEGTGANLILLTLSLDDSIEDARKTLRAVLGAAGCPLLVFGPGQAEKDNELIVAVAEEGKGERLVLGICEDKNYRTIVAAALAHGHLVNSRTPMDVNLAKQLIILIHDMGMPPERILMDPTTGALGYGIEYGYSVMERLRLAALQGDRMTQQPMLVTPGEEAWKTKEAKVGDDVPATWGEWEERAINWETLTATSLIQAGADVVVLRHPETVRRVRGIVEALMAGAGQREQ